jgi:hypothetical protein
MLSNRSQGRDGADHFTKPISRRLPIMATAPATKVVLATGGKMARCGVSHVSTAVSGLCTASSQNFASGTPH